MVNPEGDHPNQAPDPTIEPVPDRTRLRILAGVGVGVAAVLVPGLSAAIATRIANNNWRTRIQEIAQEIDVYDQRIEKLRQVIQPDTLRYGSGTIVTGPELAPNGTFEKAGWDDKVEKYIVHGWTPLPDSSNGARTYALAGKEISGAGYLAIRDDSKTPSLEDRQFWQSDPIKIDPREAYVVAFSTTCFKDELPAPNSSEPALNFLFLNSKGETIKEQKAYLQWLAMNDFDLWHRVIATIGEGQNNISPTIPPETTAIQLRFGSDIKKDLRFRMQEARFGDVSVRELGKLPQDTLGRPV